MGRRQTQIVVTRGARVVVRTLVALVVVPRLRRKPVAAVETLTRLVDQA